MSDNDIANIERTLGVLLERTETQGKQLAAIQSDLAVIKVAGCAKGITQDADIAGLKSDMDRIKGIGRKAILAVVGVAVGSVGIKELLAAVIGAVVGTQ